jgi:alanyl-tRNA synthetase
MVATADGLPDRSEVTAGQLVIHADFPIAGQHRLVRELARDIDGGGGGQAFFATAGGTRPEGLPQALQRAQDWLKS